MKYKCRRVQLPYLKTRKQLFQHAQNEDICLKGRSFNSIEKYGFTAPKPTTVDVYAWASPKPILEIN